MELIEEGEQAFFRKIDLLVQQPEIHVEDRQLLLRAKQYIMEGQEWSAVLMELLTNLTARVMAMALSPELREFYSLLYKNRSHFEQLHHDIEGSMTLLMIFD